MGDPTRADDERPLRALEMFHAGDSYGEMSRKLGGTRHLWQGRINRVLEEDRKAHGEVVQ